MSGDIKYFCTDKGQHERLRLRDAWGRRNTKDRFRGRVGRKRDHGEVVLQLHMRGRYESTPQGGRNPDKPLGGIELLCPICGRNPDLSQEKVDMLKAAGLAEVDISALPF